MNLESLYFEVQKIIDQVNFHTLWRGFSPNKFALYNDVKCVYNGILTKIAEKSPASKPPCSRSESAGGG
ncbi:hypothetical protein JOC49_001681 [Fusibacter tunisiensis]|uniref:Uncharacterized protein n=1 Tax=Fusibacter tunisiensis TaxID=1008308 RepID=A0ABS2MRT5_9FIRM|nr:hypothetical protein [Fusibacter tunisiensis]